MTLTELIIVFAVIGIIITMAVPKTAFGTYYIDSAAKDLCADIRFVHSMNMCKPADGYNIVFGTDFYMVKNIENNLPHVVKYIKLKNNYALANNAVGLIGGNTLMFNANGTPKAPGTYTVINNSSGQKREITIVPYTGRVLLIE